jgi:aspartate-semialdehyde dehydrogenase
MKRRSCVLIMPVIGIVVPFAALRQFGPLAQVSAVTMQAVSGAGYPGVSSKLSLFVNVYFCRYFFFKVRN